MNLTNLWERIHGAPKDGFYDVVLETAFHARGLLRTAQKLSDELPEHSHRAMLHAVEAEWFLENLEKANFNVFDKTLHGNSFFWLPLKIRKAAANGKYFTSIIKDDL